MIEITQWNPIPFSSHVQKHDLLDRGLEGHLHFLIEMRTTSQCCSHMMYIPLQDIQEPACTVKPLAAAPSTVADCLRSQLSTDAYTLTPLAVYLRPRLFSLSLASPGVPHSPLSSLSNNQQPGHHKGGRQTTAKDATISSTVTYPCWYAGWINHNCFQAILIHASHKCRMKCVQHLCTWCACCTAANPVHMLKMLHVKHIQKQDSPQKHRGGSNNYNNGCLWL